MHVELAAAVDSLRDSGDAKCLPFSEGFPPAVKTVIKLQRRLLASKLERDADMFAHPHVRDSILQKLKPYDSLLQYEWFRTARALRIPQLSDFLTLEQAEAANDGAAPFSRPRLR